MWIYGSKKGTTMRICEMRNATSVVKFVAALLVVNGHLFAYYSGMSSVVQWVNLGAQCVSLFLFFSASGLMCSFERKGKAYIDDFLSRRLGRIIIPLVTAYILSLLAYRVFVGDIDWLNVLATLSWGGPYMKFSWYVTEILVLYGLFYVCGRFCRDIRSLSIVLSISVVILMGVLIVALQPLWYINGLPCFIMGIAYQRYEDRILAYLSLNKIYTIASLALLFLLFFQWRYVSENVSVLSAYRYTYMAIYLNNILFVALIIAIMTSFVKTTEIAVGGV